MKNIKKILLAGVLTTAVAGGALMPTVMSYAKKGQTVNGKKVKISMQAAKDIAMKNAKSGRIVSAELDRDKGKFKYEIDVVDGNIKKEYDIDANTGAILKVEHEVVKTNNNTPNPNPNPNPSNNGVKISLQEAKDIAMKNAKSGRIVSAELDRDKGKLKYEIDIVDGNIKKEYDIDANTGAILKVEQEVVKTNNNTPKPNPTPNPSNNGAKISMQEAKDIAMRNAKSGRIVSAELDRDNGRLKYEIDIVDGNIKKEYDIDANTGAILKVEHEVVKTNNNTPNPNTNPNPKPNPNPSNNGAKISMQEAKNIAMRNAKSGRIVSAELDRDKGKLKYEIDILDGFIKKEYDIDANTGAILKVEHEDVRDDD